MPSPPSSLPISNPQSTTTTTPSSLRSFVSRISTSVRQSFSQRRPWYELIDRSAFSRPDSFSDATSRIRKNLSYFRVNYVSLITTVLAISLITHPFSLVILLCLLGAWLFLYLFRQPDQPLVILGRTFSNGETLLILSGLTIVTLFLTSIGSLVISAVLVGLAIVCAHGAFRDPEDLFMDEQEPNNIGLLSFLSGDTSSVARASPPVVPRI